MNKQESLNTVRKTSLRIPEGLALRVEALARDDSRSFNQMVVVLLEEIVSNRMKEQPDGGQGS